MADTTPRVIAAGKELGFCRTPTGLWAPEHDGEACEGLMLDQKRLVVRRVPREPDSTSPADQSAARVEDSAAVKSRSGPG